MDQFDESSVAYVFKASECDTWIGYRFDDPFVVCIQVGVESNLLLLRALWVVMAVGMQVTTHGSGMTDGDDRVKPNLSLDVLWDGVPH